MRILTVLGVLFFLLSLGGSLFLLAGLLIVLPPSFQGATHTGWHWAPLLVGGLSILAIGMSNMMDSWRLTNSPEAKWLKRILIKSLGALIIFGAVVLVGGGI